MLRSSANTGYVALTPRSGTLTITEAGAVIDGLDIRGQVNIAAPNVTIRRCIIRGGPPATQGSSGLLTAVKNAAGFLVEDVTFTPAYPYSRGDGVKVNHPGTFRRIDLSGTVDGFTVYGDGVMIEDSYLHDFVTYPTGHSDGGPTHNDAIAIQAGRGITIRGCTISGARNAAIIVTQDAGIVSDLFISNCDIDGGAASINIVTNGPSPLAGVSIVNSRFGRGQTVAGAAIMARATHCVPTITGSIWADTGQPVTIKRG